MFTDKRVDVIKSLFGNLKLSRNLITKGDWWYIYYTYAIEVFGDLFLDKWIYRNVWVYSKALKIFTNFVWEK